MFVRFIYALAARTAGASREEGGRVSKLSKFRISDEDGFNAGFRNYGRLCLALIPWALGIGALSWMAVYVWGHYIGNELDQERRAAIYTGAGKAPKSKIAVEMLNKSCVKVTRADIDGSMLYLYARNDCRESLSYLRWNWEELSPDGTVIHAGEANSCPIPTENGDEAECQFGGWFHWPEGIDTDKRVDRIRVWVSR